MPGDWLVTGKDGTIRRRYLTDGYRYDPAAGWKRIADLPRPVVAAPSLSIPVDAGRLALGTWQRVVVVDTNRENDQRRLRLTFVPG